MGNGSRRPGSELIGVMGLFGVPGGPAGKDPWKIPWRRKWQPAPVFYEQRTLVGLSPWGHKESDMTGHTDVCAHAHARTHTHMGLPKTMTISTLFMQGKALCFSAYLHILNPSHYTMK